MRTRGHHKAGVRLPLAVIGLRCRSWTDDTRLIAFQCRSTPREGALEPTRRRSRCQRSGASMRQTVWKRSAFAERSRRLVSIVSGICSHAAARRLLRRSRSPIPPSTFHLATRRPAVAPRTRPLPALDWWRGFRSRELTALMRRGADRESRHRCRGRAHRAGGRAGAHRRRSAVADRQSERVCPALAAVANDQPRRRHRSGPSERTLYSASLSASYEIDFWGKNRATLLAAEEIAVATRFEREVVALTTLASVGNTYFLVLAAQDRLRIAHSNVRSATRVLDLMQDSARGRHRVGARHRAAGERRQHAARHHPAARAAHAAEHGDACGADRAARPSSSPSAAAACRASRSRA